MSTNNTSISPVVRSHQECPSESRLNSSLKSNKRYSYLNKLFKVAVKEQKRKNIIEIVKHFFLSDPFDEMLAEHVKICELHTAIDKGLKHKAIAQLTQIERLRYIGLLSGREYPSFMKEGFEIINRKLDLLSNEAILLRQDLEKTTAT